MTATVRRIRPEPEPELSRVSASRERVPSFDWQIESVFYPELATIAPGTRRCTNCGYHGPMRRWFRHFVMPWVLLSLLVVVSLGPGLSVLLVPKVTDWVEFYTNSTVVGWGLLGFGLLPVLGFLLRYAMSYKCPHCRKVGENH